MKEEGGIFNSIILLETIREEQEGIRPLLLVLAMELIIIRTLLIKKYLENQQILILYQKWKRNKNKSKGIDKFCDLSFRFKINMCL